MAAVLFDLDDTLFPQREWLEGAWRAVADAALRFGVPREPLVDALAQVAAEGSDRGRIIDRALSVVGHPDVPVAPLVAAFVSYRPMRLRPYDGVAGMLGALRTQVPIGCVTDGNPAIQTGKLQALGLADAFERRGALR